MSLIDRILAQWRRKLLLLVVLPPLFTVCYYLPQWTPIFAARTIPLTPLDRWVPFEPWWIWPYMSMYLLLPLPPLLATRAGELWRYAVGMGVMFVVAAVFFFLWPVAYPRPALVHAGADPFYLLIMSIDRPLNALPSLHAGLTVYALLFAGRVLRELPRGAYVTLLAIGWIWAAAILYGTLATKQHYLVDLPPGAALAWVAHWLAWRRVDEVVIAEG